MPLSEWHIDCALVVHSDGKEDLTLQIGDIRRAATLHIEHLSKALLADLSPRALDLIEVAAFVYAADSTLPRGQTSDPGLGSRWRRRLTFQIPVRDHSFWRQDTVRRSIANVLSFLSDDDYHFEFTPNRIDEPPRYLGFAPDTGFSADEVLMFSGGLDSFAGALEETISRNRKVALVSHHSATKMEKAQKDLIKAMSAHIRPGSLLHVPVCLQMKGRGLRESTHRSRSFFFAVIGMVVARMFGLSRTCFYENGIVSLNLPPSGQAIGARVTRSTHPKALTGFRDLFSRVFDGDMRVDNPFIWKTKAEVVEVIRASGAADLIPLTRSCAHIREMTTVHPHCGRCSQCVDRRIAMLSLGLGDVDPILDYAVDPVLGRREKVEEKEQALGYVENARRFIDEAPGELFRRFGELHRVLAEFDEPPDAVARRLCGLLRRHGKGVLEVVRKSQTEDEPPHPESMAALAGPIEAAPGRAFVAPRPERLSTKQIELVIDPRKQEIAIRGIGVLSGVSAVLIAALAETHLRSLAKGLRPEDCEFTNAAQLAKRLEVQEPTVRRRIERFRKMVRGLALEKSAEPPADDAIIENLPWRGYRLNPDMRVFKADTRD